MPSEIADPILERNIIAQRQANGSDRWDEVWEGAYVLMPMPNFEHQGIVQRLSTILDSTIGIPGDGQVYPGVNVADRIEEWNFNYRCPDVVVFLNETEAEIHTAFSYGGPDFAVEIVSPGDRTRAKLPFYASVGTKELLIIDRNPWSLELLRLVDRELVSIGVSSTETESELTSEVVPLCFQLIAGELRPQINVRHHDGQQQWMV